MVVDGMRLPKPIYCSKNQKGGEIVLSLHLYKDEGKQKFKKLVIKTIKIRPKRCLKLLKKEV